ncbi:MAG: hypothetical protein WA373_02800, partial [Burkholderiales bacterium]
MKRMNAALTLILVLSGITASGPAFAWYGGHARVGVFIGAPVYPWYYPRYYAYYPPAVVTVPAAPPTYIERGSPQGTAAQGQQSQGYWYYCAESKTYYPYVKECPGGWQRV